MSRDFILSFTPAIARRLLLLKRFGLIDIPAEAESLAQCDRVTEANFDELICPYSVEQATVMQFLLDNDMRGIVQASLHPCIDEVTMLNIARQFSAKITVLTKRISLWRQAAKAWFLTDIDIRSPFDLPGKWIDQRRDGSLIIDVVPTQVEFICRPVVREFPHTVLYQAYDVDQPVHWTALAALLFPTMPHPSSIALANNPPHWETKGLNDFAHFYNCCIFPEFIT
jgi:hypothetical protein